MNIFANDTALGLPAQEDARLVKAPEPPIHSLPIHLAANVLLELGDIKDIPSVILSHPIFHAAFNEFPSLCRDILRAELPDDECYVLALIAHESHSARRLRRSENLDAHTFVSLIRDDPFPIVAAHRGLRLTEALRIGDLHGAVVCIRDRFARSALARLYRLDPDNDAEIIDAKVASMSASEIRRIERALYRFQIYCNLFSFLYRKGGDDVESKRIFYDQYSSWVNEQLGCVHDFLEVLIAQEIDAVVKAKGDDAKFLEGGKQSRKQQFLSLGLTLIWDVLQAPNVDVKYSILKDATVRLLNRATPPSPSFAQGEWKYREPESPSAWGINIKDFTRARETDPGPRAVWEEMHVGVGSRDLFFLADHSASLRRLGSVMWDSARLDADPICRESLVAAKDVTTPTFMSPKRLMNPARSWDKQFRPAAIVRPRPSARLARLVEGV